MLDTPVQAKGESPMPALSAKVKCGLESEIKFLQKLDSVLPPGTVNSLFAAIMT